MQVKNGKTVIGHWDDVWSAPPSPRLPSSLMIGTRNLQQLLKKTVLPGSKFLEIGCAPGKMLAWVAAVLKAEVSGLDYSEAGIGHCRWLFEKLDLQGDLRCEDVFNNSFAPGSFDFVYSAGVIEHFDDPRNIIQVHLDLLKENGAAIVTVPNYSGIYKRLQNWCDAPNLALHNLNIMTPSALEALLVGVATKTVHAYHFGAVSPWIVNFDKRMPRSVARIISLGVNAAGLLQPFTLKSLAPMLVLEIRKGGDL